jgi:hypothetical protein
MNKEKILIEQLEKLTNKKVILKEEEILEEVNLDKSKLENLARRAFMMTLSRQAVKNVYLQHFTTLLQAVEEKDQSKINQIITKYKSKILDLYDNFTVEKDLLL